MKKHIVFLCLLLGLAGCSAKLIYYHLDWLIPWHVDDYISLDRDQRTMLENRLIQQLEWHCHTQLPDYAASLRKLGDDLRNPAEPISLEKLGYYNRTISKHWKELMKSIGPDIADILMTASDDQIAELFANLEKHHQKLKAEYISKSPEILDRNRQQRMIKRMEYWLGSVTAEQKKAVADWSSQLEPIAADWLQNRERMQTKFQRLLKGRTMDPDFKVNLVGLLVDAENYRSAAYQLKIKTNTNMTFLFLQRIDRQLAPSQRSYLLKRIESLARDFDQLSCDPAEVKGKK
ncbi:MAG: DUF6279 family lipoprotein [Desulfobacterales bacterium]